MGESFYVIRQITCLPALEPGLALRPAPAGTLLYLIRELAQSGAG